jgi:4-alpha-glucanotransferase
MHRTSGIVLHPTSLPGPYGVGDLGHGACRFVDFLAAAGQGLWQMLPLGPTGYGDSPYQCLSAFAGNPLLISPDFLVDEGWIDATDLGGSTFPPDQVAFGPVRGWKLNLLGRVYERFQARAGAAERGAFASFCDGQAHWLDAYALFAGLKAAHDQRPWTDWPEALALRDARTLAAWGRAQAEDLQRERFFQFVFARQWARLRAYAHERGVRLVGDIPIFVAHDSSEVWSHPEWFHLDGRGLPTVVAGVPPDYFSATGQRWGNPLYRWDRLAETGYRFWVDRLRHTLELVDLVRIDHFRGFAAYWEIPGGEPTAVRGRWVPGPGLDLFRAVRQALGDDLPLIAEDLGVITEDVEALRDGLALPGMAILQFAFESTAGGFGRNQYLPHNHRKRLVVYTGTHDNNTVRGWWAGAEEPVRDHVRRYLNTDGANLHWDFIRAALSSVADSALFPLQDALGLGAEACMNRPGTADGNWTWRFTEECLTPELAVLLRELSDLYGRLPHRVG